MGHSEDLSCTEVIVRPAVRGTANVYSSDRFRPSGNGGGSNDELHNRSELTPSLFRTRLRWPNSGDSRPFFFSHLDQCLINRVVTMQATYFNIVLISRGVGISTIHAFTENADCYTSTDYF